MSSQVKVLALRGRHLEMASYSCVHGRTVSSENKSDLQRFEDSQSGNRNRRLHFMQRCMHCWTTSNDAHGKGDQDLDGRESLLKPEENLVLDWQWRADKYLLS